MVQVVALANHKGGVGKSTTTLMLAEALALLHEKCVLVIDLDPQAMVSRQLMGPEALEHAAAGRATLLELVLDRLSRANRPTYQFISTAVSDIKELRTAQGHGRIDLLPMHPHALAAMPGLEQALLKADPQAAPGHALHRILARELAAVMASYDVVLLDCPAGVTPFVLAALKLATVIIAPTVLERNSLDALTHFLRFILDRQLDKQGSLQANVFILPTLFVRSNPMQQMLLDQLVHRQTELNAIPIPIAHSTAIQRAALHAGPGHMRPARDKYGASFDDLRQLSDWLVETLRKLERAHAATRAKKA